jgi:hypothetical protein
LAKGDYCHFTSPIRRYADLIVHRSLQAFLTNPPQQLDKVPGQNDLAEFARHISDTERTSAEAESETKQIKMLEYLDFCTKQDPQPVFEGVITDVRMMGLMVEATDLGARGVIKREDLPRGDWRFEQSQMRWVSRAGLQFQLGQKIQMQVARIDFLAKFVDFRIAGDALPESVGPVGRSTPREIPSKKFRSEKPPKGKPERSGFKGKEKGKFEKSQAPAPPKAKTPAPAAPTKSKPHATSPPPAKAKRPDARPPASAAERQDLPSIQWSTSTRPAGTPSRWTPKEKPEGTRSKWSPKEKPPGTPSKWSTASDTPAPPPPPKKSPKRRR